jgi:hypothetical protein
MLLLRRLVAGFLPGRNRDRAHVKSYVIYGGQSGTSSPSTSASPATHSTYCTILNNHLPSIIRGWYNRPNVADVPSGLGLTPPQETKR